MAGSVAVSVGVAADRVLDPLKEAGSKWVVGPGDKAGVQVGPLIRADHRDRVAAYVERGVAEGAELLVDGRGEMARPGFFLGPTLLDRVTPDMTVGHEEVFGPVLSFARAATLDEAIAQANRMALGNMATIFTQSGRAAREFRDRVEAGMTGINVPLAQPLPFFPLSGEDGSFFWALHVRGTVRVAVSTLQKGRLTPSW